LPHCRQELHHADVHLVHFRADDRAVTLLDWSAGNAAPSKLDRQGEPDRLAPDDQNWSLAFRDLHSAFA